MYPPILLSPSLRAIDHAPTPNPRRFRPLWCAPTHTGASAARSHENDDDDDDEVPSNAERRAWCNRDTRVTSNNARAHVAARRHDRDHGNDSDHDRDRCGPPRRRASCTSWDAAPSLAMAVEVPAVTRRVKRAARHAHRASRACMCTSSPRIARIVTVSVPPAHDRHARATAALARSIDRARCGVGDGGEGGGRLHRAPCASRKTRVTRVHEHAINAHRARHHRFPFPPGTRE